MPKKVEEKPKGVQPNAGVIKLGASKKIRNKVKRSMAWKQEKAFKKKAKKERKETREREAKQLGDKVIVIFNHNNLL
jgi:hypothetical protein